MPKPALSTFPVFFHKYVALVPDENLTEAFSNQQQVIEQFLSSITEEKSAYAYDTGKWTLKEVLQHIIDTERIFNFRALCFSRKETESLPGFDENFYAANSDANRRTWKDLVEEFMAVRKSTELMFKSFTTDMLEITGNSNNNSATVYSMGFITLGHFYHHKKIMQERYLSA
ncbi:MAG: DinB family protein [Ferruginibacter sp.]